MSSELDYELYEGVSYKKKERSKYYSIRSPLPGRIYEVLVKEGDCVRSGQVVVIVECMKTLVEITIPKHIDKGVVVWVKKCYDKPCVVQQNEELVRMRIDEEY